VFPVSIYGFWAFGALTCLLLIVAYAVQYGTLSRFLAYLSVSASTAAIACMFDVAVLLGPHGPSRLADEIWLVERSFAQKRNVLWPR
jgi:hypothetical protein